MFLEICLLYLRQRKQAQKNRYTNNGNERVFNYFEIIKIFKLNHSFLINHISNKNSIEAFIIREIEGFAISSYQSSVKIFRFFFPRFILLPFYEFDSFVGVMSFYPIVGPAEILFFFTGKDPDLSHIKDSL